MSDTAFKPRFGLANKHLQTAFRVIFKPEFRPSENCLYEEILLQLSDGDYLWLEHNRPDKWNGWYLVLIHGMEGDSGSHYMLSMAGSAAGRGYGVIRMNMRNCGKGLGYASRPYNAGKTDDLQEVVDFVHSNLSKNIFISGYSLSANLVLKYFGEKRNHKAAGFSAVSPPFHLHNTCNYIDSWRGLFYRKRFLGQLTAKVKNGFFPAYTGQIKFPTFYSFDDRVTAPLSGYKNAADYYNKCSAIRFLGLIRHRGIVIHSTDDPVVPAQDWLDIQWEKQPNLKTVITSRGGHLGFICKKTPDIPDGRWLDRIILNYFDNEINKT